MTIKALPNNCRLATNPTNPPKYAVEVENNAGGKDTLGDPRATRALVALMNQHAVIGGAAAHWGGPAAFAEMMSSLHAIMFKKSNWFDHYNFVNDAGHAENGVYALRANYGFDGMDFNTLKGFRSIESKLTGHGEAHLNPEGVYISNGPLGSGVPQAQGLALADKLLGNQRVTVCTLSDGGSMEGEAKESFAAIPGLAAKGKMNPFVLLISDNNTKLSGRIGEDSFDMNPTFKSLETLGWDLSTVEKGHDLQTVHLAVENAIAKAEKNPSRPVAVVFKTIKGYGVKSTEESASGGHGYPLKAYDEKLTDFIAEIFDGNAPEEMMNWSRDILATKPEAKPKAESAVVIEKVQPGFARSAIKAAEKGLPVFSVCADLQGSTGIAGFHKKFPELKLDVGVAEANMISTAVGLSKQGLIPIVDTFSQFGITKGNLPLIMAGLSQAPVIGLFSHTGFQDAADGASHQATTYISTLASIPHLQLVSCSCSSEAEAYMDYAINHFVEMREQGKTPDSIIFLLGRENHPASYVEGQTYPWGKAQVLREGKEGTVVCTGPMVQHALKAAEQADLTIINNPFINRIDLDTISNSLAKTSGRLITMEDHQVVGGMGSLLVHQLALKGVDFKVKSLGIQGQFGQSAYKADHLYQQHGISADGVIAALKSF